MNENDEKLLRPMIHEQKLSYQVELLLSIYAHSRLDRTRSRAGADSIKQKQKSRQAAKVSFFLIIKAFFFFSFCGRLALCLFNEKHNARRPNDNKNGNNSI